MNKNTLGGGSECVCDELWIGSVHQTHALRDHEGHLLVMKAVHARGVFSLEKRRKGGLSGGKNKTLSPQSIRLI